METFSAPANMISAANIKQMSFISEAEEALLINLSVDCKYVTFYYLGSVLGFIFNKKKPIYLGRHNLF